MQKPKGKRVDQLKPGQSLPLDWPGETAQVRRSQDGRWLNYFTEGPDGPVLVRSAPFPAHKPTAPLAISGADLDRDERNELDRYEAQELAEVGRPFTSGRGE